MSWLLPSALGIGGLAAAVAVALHFISRRRPVAEPFPPARFIPARAIQARVPERAFGDPLLLALRILAIALLAAAVAAPVLAPRGHSVARVLVIDRSANVASVDELRDSLRALVGGTDATVLMDSAAAAVSGPLDVSRLALSSARGSLSAGLAAGIAAAGSLAGGADSIAMTIVTPVAPTELDDATWRIRATWPGALRVVPLRATMGAYARGKVQVLGDSTGALRASLALDGLLAVGADSAAATVRIERGDITGQDSIWARASGHVLVGWPVATPSGARGVSAVAAGDDVVVGLFAPAPRPGPGRVVARWMDGAPATVEQALGSGCVRSVAVGVDEHSDITLTPAFRRLVRAFVAPCGAAPLGGGLARAADVDSLRGRGHAAADAAAFRLADRKHSPYTPWLLLAGAVLLVVEMALRRSARRAVA